MFRSRDESPERGLSVDSITVFGASGKTGRTVVRLAVDRGLKVKAFLREGSSLDFSHESLEIVRGSLDDLDKLKDAIKGTGAVVIALGPHRQNPQAVTAKATASVIRAAREVGTTRLVCVTGGLIGDYPGNRSYFFERMRKSAVKRQPVMMKDRDDQERFVKGSQLEWTVFKPPRLTEKSAKGGCKAGTDVKVGLLSSVTRGDLASFIVDEIQNPKHLRECVFIKN